MIIEKIKSSKDATLNTQFHLGMAVTRLDDALLIAGGNDGGTLVDTFTSIDTVSHERSVLPNLPFSVSGHCTCVFNDSVYLFGGLRSDQSQDVVMFHFDTYTWKRLDVTTTTDVGACFTYESVIYILDSDAAKTLDSDHVLQSKELYRYKNRGKFVAIDAPNAYFSNFVFDVATENTIQYSAEFAPDIYTSIPYVDKMIGMPVSMGLSAPYKLFGEHEHYSTDASSGKYVHALLGHEIYSFNTRLNTWFKSYPLSEKTYSGSSQRLPLFDDAVNLSCSGTVIEIVHYDSLWLSFDELELHTLTYKSRKGVKTNTESFSQRPFFNMHDTRIAYINGTAYAYGGMGLHKDTGKLNGCLYNLDNASAISIDIEARTDHQVDAYNGSLIVTGGRNGRTYNHVYKINPHTGAVYALKRLPVSGLYNHVSTVASNKLILAGGKDATHNDNTSVFVYDLMTNQYQTHESATEGNVFSIVSNGAITYIMSYLDSEIKVIKLTGYEVINIKTIPTQLKEITSASACKEDSNNILMLLTMSTGSDPQSIIYRLGLK